MSRDRLGVIDRGRSGCTGTQYQPLNHIPSHRFSCQSVWKRTTVTMGHMCVIQHSQTYCFLLAKQIIIVLPACNSISHTISVALIEPCHGNTDLKVFVVVIPKEGLADMGHANPFWAHLCHCTVGSYASLSVCTPSVTWPKFRLEKNAYLGK